jgi:alpha-galactosidase
MRFSILTAYLFTFILSSHALHQLQKGDSANGRSVAFKGWSSFPLQAYNLPGTKFGSNWLSEANLRDQALALSKLGSGYDTFMIDSGWSDGGAGDNNGRITWNTTVFQDFPQFVADLKSLGLKVGIYVIPGVFTGDINANKQILGSTFKMQDINSACSGTDFPCSFGRTDLDFENHADASNAWVKSVVNQFADL